MSITADLPRSVQRPTNVRYMVLAALLVITAINYIQRNCISPALTTIEEELSIKPWMLDIVTGAFFWSYTFLQVPSGWLAKRWGSRRTLPLYATGWSLALVVCALAAGFPGLLIGRLAMGILQAGIFPCCTLILSVWYPASQRGLATALLNSFMLIGGAAGTMLAGELLKPLGWRGLFLSYAAPGIVWSLWFLWWFRNHPSEHPGVNQAELDLLPRQVASTEEAPAPQSSVHKASWVLILTSVPLLLLCAQQCCRAAANRLFDSRLPTYLERERDVAKKQAAQMSSWPQWAGVLGGICGGALSDAILRRTRRRVLARNGVAIASLAISTLIYLSAYFIADVSLAMVVLSAGMFVFSFSSPCSYALCIDIGGKHLAIAFGMMNMIGNLGSAIFTSSIMSMVALGGWELALGVWLSLHVVAIGFWLFLDPEVVIGEPRTKV